MVSLFQNFPSETHYLLLEEVGASQPGILYPTWHNLCDCTGF